MTSQTANSPHEEAALTPPDDVQSPARVLRRRNRILMTVAVLAVIGWAAHWIWSIETGLERAQRAADRHDWTQVRDRLKAYLVWHSRDASANLLMAEAVIKTDTAGSGAGVNLAIEHLQRIEDDSPLAARARLQEARLVLLNLGQPGRAERLLRESLRRDPNGYDANLLLWKLLDLTGRHVAAGEFFWRAYELSPVAERGERLRDWFLAEFYPETANEPFYRVFGAAEVGKIPASVNLLVRFRENEPAASSVHAALAAWYLERGEPRASLELLKEVPDLSAAMEDPFVSAVLCEALIELGQFEKARTCFQQFPAPHSGYVFWRVQGMFLQYVQNDPGAAADTYNDALATWPAKYDWELMMRLCECLRKTGRSDEADRLQSRVKFLTTSVLTLENMKRLQVRLSERDNRDVARELRDMYREFGLTREAAAWDEYRRGLLEHVAPIVR